MTIRKIPGFDQIRSLTDSTITSIFNNPDKSAERVQKVAGEVLSQLPQARDCLFFVAFYKSIVQLDREYFKRYQTHPFGELIDRMKAVLPQTEQKAEAACQKFRDKLSSLDFESPRLKQDIFEMKEMIADLMTLEEAAPILKCLESIQTRFKAGLMEARASALICERSEVFARSLGDAQFLITSAEKEVTRDMIRCLRNCSKCPFSEMSHRTQEKHMELLRSIVLKRVECAISRMPANSPFNEHFINNFFILIENLHNFHVALARPTFEARWERSLSLMDEPVRDLLCRLLPFYPELNPAEFIPELCGKAEMKYLKNLKLADLCSSTPLQQLFDKKNKTIVQKLESFYDSLYRKYLLECHAWIGAYGQYIKKPYSQAADTDRNLEQGTCFQNALDRFALLLKRPCPNAAEIPMGSTQAGRVTQSILRCTFTDAKTGLIPLKEAQKLQTQACARLGLKTSTGTPVCKTPAELIKFLSPKENFLGILLLTCKEGGYAMNIQIDHQNKIFRFIDDNLGIFEINDFDTFTTIFKDYLESFYSEYNAFGLQTFSPAEK